MTDWEALAGDLAEALRAVREYGGILYDWQSDALAAHDAARWRAKLRSVAVHLPPGFKAAGD